MGSHGTILVIEDDDAIRESLVDVLVDEGYEVVSAANGAAALEQLRTLALPRLILLDVMMPVMDGFAFRAAQARESRLADIPVLVLSADGNAAKLERLRPNGVLRKPFALDALFEALGKLL